jgi:nucleoside transporter
MFLPPMLATPDNANLFVYAIFAHMLCYMPTLGLVNTLSFHNLTNQEKQFPLIRVFGTLGWFAANNVVSGYMGADTDDKQFYVTAGAAILLGLYSFFLPGTPPPGKGKRVTVKEVLGLEALSLLRDRSFAIFMVCSFLICIPLAAYYAYAPVYIGAVGFEKVGSWMSLGQASEVFFMVVMPLFFARLGVKWMLAVGMLAWVLRYGAFAWAADDGTVPLIILGILLHGICYDFFFVTGQIYVDQKAPVEMRGKAQGFLVLVTLGLGMLIGTIVSGKLVEHYSSLGTDGVEKLVDWSRVWLAPTVGAAAILLIFVLLFRDRSRETTRQG